MKIEIFGDKQLLSRMAAERAAHAICEAILEHGYARIVAASQLAFLDALTHKARIDDAGVPGGF